MPEKSLPAKETRRSMAEEQHKRARAVVGVCWWLVVHSIAWRRGNACCETRKGDVEGKEKAASSRSPARLSAASSPASLPPWPPGTISTGEYLFIRFSLHRSSSPKNSPNPKKGVSTRSWRRDGGRGQQGRERERWGEGGGARRHLISTEGGDRGGSGRHQEADRPLHSPLGFLQREEREGHTPVAGALDEAPECVV